MSAHLYMRFCPSVCSSAYVFAKLTQLRDEHRRQQQPPANYSLVEKKNSLRQTAKGGFRDLLMDRPKEGLNKSRASEKATSLTNLSFDKETNRPRKCFTSFAEHLLLVFQCVNLKCVGRGAQWTIRSSMENNDPRGP